MNIDTLEVNASESEENKASELSERLQIIIDLKELQPSKFADEISVQRSSMSHIIAGRNKPSLDFLQKVVQRFPDVNINWILSGVGEPIFSEKKEKPKNDIEISTEFEKEKDKSKELPNKEKEIERIVVFYSDKTFDTFNQFNAFKPNK
jgi:transcriptional regulator with XRE-family HTH domain